MLQKDREGSRNLIISGNKVYFLHGKQVTTGLTVQPIPIFLAPTGLLECFYLKTRRRAGKKSVGEKWLPVCSSYQAN